MYASSAAAAAYGTFLGRHTHSILILPLLLLFRK